MIVIVSRNELFGNSRASENMAVIADTDTRVKHVGVHARRHARTRDMHAPVARACMRAVPCRILA